MKKSYQKLLENPIKSLGRAFWHSLYPPFCLHCDHSLDGAKTLCYSCQLLLEKIDVHERCPYCFSAEKVMKWRMCRDCYQKPLMLNGFCSIFDDIGPAFDLIRQFQSGKAYLSESFGAFLIDQWSNISWPIPDYIVPVVPSLSSWFQKGYNPEGLLAKEMASYLQVPWLDILKRASYQTEEPCFKLKKRRDLNDSIVLVINGRYDSGKTLRAAAQTLRGGGAAKIYAMSVTRRVG